MKPLSEDEARQLPESVFYRIVRGDSQGRPFGTPRNPRLPTREEFNPRMDEIPAGELADRIKGRKHGLYPEQAARIRQMSDEELLRYRVEDPLSGYPVENGFSITGGHHRLHEIMQRVETGALPPETLVRILIHD